VKIANEQSAFLLEIRKSAIDRKGVFAAQTIPAFHKVMEYTGEKIRFREAHRRYLRVLRSRGEKRIYLARLSRGWIIDGAVGGNGAELINHSCDPNLFVKREHGKLNLYSKRRIRQGDELTTDYRFPADSPRLQCRCGAANCRGTINLKK
jgi:SET domain-containing protein